MIAVTFSIWQPASRRNEGRNLLAVRADGVDGAVSERFMGQSNLSGTNWLAMNDGRTDLFVETKECWRVVVAQVAVNARRRDVESAGGVLW